MIRNLAEIGPNLQKIITRLQSNQNLLKLLYYTDKDPLNQPDLTPSQIKEEIFEKLIKIVPKVDARDDAKSIIAIKVPLGQKNDDNTEFMNNDLSIEVFVPMTQWLIKDANLRPFAIMGEIDKTLNGKSVDGWGKILGGDFEIVFLTDEMSDYELHYQIINYA